tara:strand:- start:777 stop:1151 length:375 start_codon:yes stop_codon:yes gene_type:complete
MIKAVTIKLTEQQYDLIERIAKEDKRRIKDLAYLFFSEGIKYFYMDTSLSIERLPNEYTKDELAQIKKNEKLAKTAGWSSLDYEKRAAKGYKHISTWMGAFDDGETFLDRLSKEVASNAFREEF